MVHPWIPESRRRLAASITGKVVSQETKDKISASMKRMHQLKRESRE